MVNKTGILGCLLGLIILITLFTGIVSPLTTVFAQKNAVSPSGKLPPNELGRIMILEYHLIGYPEARWCRTPENFRKDLQLLYDNDYYPVALDDIISGNFKVPAGKTPFTITFDDSTEGQFRYLKQGDRLVIDPKSAVGIMEQFKKEHPDFPVTATFYVLTGTSAGHRLFGQEEYVQQKLEFLLKNGYEIGNHTHTHKNLSKLVDEQVQKQLALNVKTVQKYLPNYEVRSFALPYGVHPKNRNLSRSGEYQGQKYNNRSVMLVGSGSVPSPYSVDFNPYQLERIQAGDFEWGPGAFVQRYKKNPTLRFVSDGDPKMITVFKSQQSKLAPEVTKRFKVKVVED
ncbi:MAG TPA: polysaccharide deacetylase family protein [Bacillota bacterium]|jgi:peptidoglycan/xylan/chitin deacetylase (PgdA/CDA1 family)|nr:polysaccharide deacetylase family protein [Bacillota bacterium]HOL10842.1 polysaccharide deacetylase family protein [Bacillota bacterium]HPO98569.1 polysaccharide deacetylase family protein [Bacillota bacterium]